MTIKQLQHALSGEYVTSAYFTKQIKLLLLIFGLFLLYIGYGYLSQNQIKYANRLHKEVEDARNEEAVLHCRYEEYSRISNVYEVLRQNGRNLKISTQPPVKL